MSVDIYDERDADVALAMLDPEPWGNAAWRAQIGPRDAYLRRDRPAFLQSVDPDWVHIDERRNVRLRLAGSDAMEAFETFIANEYGTFDCELLATREDRLALVRLFVTVADGDTGRSDVEALSIVDSGFDGRIVWSAAFDPDDLVGAYAALDERYVEVGGALYMNVMRDAFDARNWDAFATLFAPDCTFVDGLTMGWGPINIETFIDYMRSTVELAPDARMWNDHVRRRGNVHLSVGRTWGRHAGGAFEIAYLTVGVTDADDQLRHVETYDATDATKALARFEELAADAQAGNVAWHAAQRLMGEFERRDWPGVLGLLDPAFVYNDLRRGARLRLAGDDALLMFRTLIELDDFTWDEELIATRGDRLALRRIRTSFADGHAGPSEVVSLSLFECSANGLLTAQTVFDADDLATAYATLVARHAELVAEASGNAASRAAASFCDAVNRRDWDGLVALLAPTIDHMFHEQRLHTHGEEVLESYRILLSLDEISYERSLLATRGERLALTAHRLLFHDGQAGPAEVLSLMLHEVDQLGLISHVEGFAADDFAHAYAAIDARHAEIQAEAAGNGRSRP